MRWFPHAVIDAHLEEALGNHYVSFVMLRHG